DRVVVMDAGSRKITGGSLYFTISNDANPANTDPTHYALPALPQSVYLIYGVATSNPGAPFNRVDYYLKDPGIPPSECATGTHTLYRGVMNSSGNFGPPYYPLLHCVADFQVGFGLDTNGDGKINSWVDGSAAHPLPSTADKIRSQLKQVRVYILVQNGTKDKDYNYPHNLIYVGDNSIGIGRNFALSTQITDHKHYRWKLIKLVVEPKNLGVSK
ncbi:MAG: PilW family protein, partial [Desulfurellaceae bacterium]|nr:PilW family protein [Desulfurellaceae bacterium]